MDVAVALFEEAVHQVGPPHALDREREESQGYDRRKAERLGGGVDLGA